MLLLSSSDFSKITFFQKFFQEHCQSVKQFGFRSGQTFFSPDLGPNYLQRLTADNNKPPITRKELKLKKKLSAKKQQNIGPNLGLSCLRKVISR